MYVVPAPLRPVMVFVIHDEKDRALGASFQQNALQRVNAGDEAEVAFDAVPWPGVQRQGASDPGCDRVGQLQATARLRISARKPAADARRPSSTVTDDVSRLPIPVGAGAQVAVYTEHWHELSLLRKILLRMRSWENYVFLEGH